MQNYILNDNTFSSEVKYISSINSESIAKSNNRNLGKQYSLIFNDRLKKGMLVETEFEAGCYLISNKELDITEQGKTYEEAVENFLTFLSEDFQNLKSIEPDKLDPTLNDILLKYQELMT